MARGVVAALARSIDCYRERRRFAGEWHTAKLWSLHHAWLVPQGVVVNPDEQRSADGEPVSPEQFTRLAADPGRSVVVEACAGSGKTWLLVSRMLRLLLAGAQPAELPRDTY